MRSKTSGRFVGKVRQVHVGSSNDPPHELDITLKQPCTVASHLPAILEARELYKSEGQRQKRPDPWVRAVMGGLHREQCTTWEKPFFDPGQRHKIA